jgi:hypothetical protein
MDQDSKVLIVDTVIQPGRGENTLDGFLADLGKADETNYKLLEPPAPLNKAWSDCKTQRCAFISGPQATVAQSRTAHWTS